MAQSSPSSPWLTAITAPPPCQGLLGQVHDCIPGGGGASILYSRLISPRILIRSLCGCCKNLLFLVPPFCGTLSAIGSSLSEWLIFFLGNSNNQEFSLYLLGWRCIIWGLPWPSVVLTVPTGFHLMSRLPGFNCPIYPSQGTFVLGNSSKIEPVC